MIFIHIHYRSLICYIKGMFQQQLIKLWWKEIRDGSPIEKLIYLK